MSSKAPTRRDFLGALGAASATVAIPQWLWGCVSEAEFQGRNQEWEAQAAQIEADGLYTFGNPGPWEGKEAVHVPLVSLNEGQGTVTVTVEHVMEADHYIPLVYIRNQNGFIIGLREFSADEPAAVVDFPLPAGTTSVTAFAFCNLHNNWVNEPSGV